MQFRGQEMNDTYDVGIGAATAIKELSPLIAVAAFETALGVDKAEVEETIAHIKSVCLKQAYELVQRLDFVGNNEWAISNFANIIAKRIQENWQEEGKKSLEKNWADLLAPLASEEMYKSLPPTWGGTSREYSIAATMIFAMSTMMQRYSEFNLFLWDVKPVMQQVQNELLSSARDNAYSLSEKLGGGEENTVVLYQSFLKHGGLILSSIWSGYAKTCLFEYENFDAKNKADVEQNGFSLDPIFKMYREQIAFMSNAVSASMMTGYQLRVVPHSIMEMVANG
jgi:hypothetical protein